MTLELLPAVDETSTDSAESGSFGGALCAEWGSSPATAPVMEEDFDDDDFDWGDDDTEDYADEDEEFTEDEDLDELDEDDGELLEEDDEEDDEL